MQQGTTYWLERVALPYVEAPFPVVSKLTCVWTSTHADVRFLCGVIRRYMRMQGALDILAGLPEHLCDRSTLLRRLLAMVRSAPAGEQAPVVRELLQKWLPFGKQPKAFVAWAEFLEQCTDAEARS